MDAKFVKLRDTAVVPTKGSDKAAGYDVYASDGTYIMPGQTKLIPTGLAIQPPDGFCIKIYARSGLASQRSSGIQVNAALFPQKQKKNVGVKRTLLRRGTP